MPEIAEEIAAQIGDNHPPGDLEILRQRLDANEDYQNIIKRKDALLESATRVPLKIETEDQAKRLSELRSYIRACRQKAEEAHKTEKDPHWKAGKLVDAYFLEGIVKILQAADDKLEPRERGYKLAVVEEERRRLKAEADAKQLEADLRAAIAVNDADMDQAIKIEEEAKSMATAAALAKPADLGARITNDLGQTKGLRTKWGYRVVDITKVPLRYLTVDDARIKTHIAERAKDRPPVPLSGIEFFPDYKA